MPLCSQLKLNRNNPEFLDIPIVSTVRRFNWEECPNSLAHDKIAPTLERRISRFSHGYAAKGLHNLAQHAIGELLLHPRGLFSSRTYTSVRLQPLCLEDSDKLTSEVLAFSTVIPSVASRGSTSSSSSIASKARLYEARRVLSLLAKS